MTFDDDDATQTIMMMMLIRDCWEIIVFDLLEFVFEMKWTTHQMKCFSA